MTRNEFNEFLMRYLWRSGDADLLSDLAMIIRLGESRLSRDLIVQRRLNAGVSIAVSRILPYPPNYHSLRTLATGGGAWEYVTPHQLLNETAAGSRALHYSLTNDGVLLGNAVSPSVENPVSFELSYYTLLPDYSDAETWVQQFYFDLYMFACLAQSAPYLREDDRVAEWQQFYTDTLATVLADDAHRQYDGSPLRMKHPGVVA